MDFPTHKHQTSTTRLKKWDWNKHMGKSQSLLHPEHLTSWTYKNMFLKMMFLFNLLIFTVPAVQQIPIKKVTFDEWNPLTPTPNLRSPQPHPRCLRIIGLTVSPWESWGVFLFQIVVTPWKINMEPINHPFRKENHLPNLHDYVPC